MNIRIVFIVTITLITTICCDKKNNENNATYFGGHVINPKQNFITLSKNDRLLDTFYLDNQNRFLAKINVETEGLYSFNHGFEYQNIYFESKDSILFRLNTWDFDESLVFSGKGSEKNNFLITLYLQNEKEEHSYSPFYSLESHDFEEKIKASQTTNNNLYQQLIESGVKISAKFDELANVAINYTLYRKKEFYPLIHKNRFQLKDYPELSDSYYDFRKGNNLNNEDLIDFTPFHNYVSSYIYALTYRQKKEDSNFTVAILNNISSNIHVNRLKDKLLYQAIYNDFRKARTSCTINKKALLVFNKNCTNKQYLRQINSLAKDCDKITNNTNLSDFRVMSLDQKEANINSIIKNNNSVIYFWSPMIISPDMLVRRVKALEQKFPELVFIGINMDSSKHSNRVNKLLSNQYILTKNSDAHSYISSLEPRTILIDKDGVISNSFTYLSSPHLEEQLSQLK